MLVQDKCDTDDMMRRVGAARFLTAVTLRLGSDVKPHAGTLIKVLFRSR